MNVRVVDGLKCAVEEERLRKSERVEELDEEEAENMAREALEELKLRKRQTEESKGR